MSLITVVRRSGSLLVASALGGTQYLTNGAALVIEGPMTVTLNSDVYASAGVYVLFDWTSGGSFPDPSQVSNIQFVNNTVYNIKRGPVVVGTQVLFELAA